MTNQVNMNQVAKVTVEQLTAIFLKQGTPQADAVAAAERMFKAINAGQAAREHINVVAQEKAEEVAVVNPVTEIAATVEVNTPVVIETVAPVEQEEKKEALSPVKSAYVRAMSKLPFFSKAVVIGRLTNEQLDAEEAGNQELVEELEVLIQRVENEPGFLESLEPTIARIKGWSVDGAGRIENGYRLVSERIGHATAVTTSVTGKSLKTVAKVIDKAGDLLVNNADKVGGFVEGTLNLPFDVIKNSKKPKATN